MINALSMLQSVPSSAASSGTQASTGKDTSFGNLLGNLLDGLSQSQKAADTQSNLLATGQAPNIDTVMIATEKASLSLQLAVQVRNKAVEAYQSMMSMQI